ncbi:helix-turn-helix domain-containing protein [Natronorubrum halophilum]|uniref:helix-turn-helix domain-containing protein n=1 Tax=Natronorubrum halophilum TaxID=1702106 RepID=UPI000EF6DBD3|nr:helix-turn-helix domain-containing protein [Natronorubrum halophilum]
MPQITVKLNGMAVDGWLAEISTEFPDSELRILATQVRDVDALVILEARTSSPGDLAARFESTPEVDSFERLHSDDRMVLIRFSTSSTKSFDPLSRSKNISVYPTTLRDGWFTVTLIASHERLSKYTDELAAAEIPYRVLSLAQSYDSSELLTDRQSEIISRAVECGYYETPRSCTVTELSALLGIHKSAASRLLHRAESRIIRAFVDDGVSGDARE